MYRVDLLQPKVQGRKNQAGHEGTLAEGKFFIFHDCILKWWTPEAQKHITARGYGHWQMRILPQRAPRFTGATS